MTEFKLVICRGCGDDSNCEAKVSENITPRFCLVDGSKLEDGRDWLKKLDPIKLVS